MSDYTPKPEHKFTFGLWTVGSCGRDPFGAEVREHKSPAELVRLFGEVGAYGVNFHDNDLIPIDATPTEAEAIKKEFRKALSETGLVVPMATTNLFSDPVFKDGCVHQQRPQGPRLCPAKNNERHRPGCGVRGKGLRLLGRARRYRNGFSKSAVESIKRSREAMNFLCDYALDKKYDLKFALEAKPNEPRGDIYNPTTGHMLAFIGTLDHPGDGRRQP